MHSVTAVWGVGNEIMGDDAAGICSARLIKRKDLPWIKVFLCGTLPENYISPLERLSPKTLLIIDAADIGERAGEFRLLRISDIGGTAFSTHGIPLGILLAPLEPKILIRIIAIQPLETKLAGNISPQVRAAARKVASAVCENSWENIPPLQRQNLSPR